MARMLLTLTRENKPREIFQSLSYRLNENGMFNFSIRCFYLGIVLRSFKGTEKNAAYFSLSNLYLVPFIFKFSLLIIHIFRVLPSSSPYVSPRIARTAGPSWPCHQPRALRGAEATGLMRTAAGHPNRNLYPAGNVYTCQTSPLKL